jgi:hypothetical protein
MPDVLEQQEPVVIMATREHEGFMAMCPREPPKRIIYLGPNIKLERKIFI